MRTFLKYAAIFAAGVLAQRVARMGMRRLDKALEGIEDVPNMGSSSASKKD